ncbi:hypothetical protein AN963_09690 [Brevibacillus choshinensis]|uniref:Uncharacterized protein n=1 Tax=Brevibacillus choshinensis TaxID=54911 RepID=A0ABR5NEU5_BRECH|nr:hypothetical protein AN963_09690 [Brevibacillus choshinensis]
MILRGSKYTFKPHTELQTEKIAFPAWTVAVGKAIFFCSFKIKFLYENEYPEIGTAKKLSYFERKIESLGIF